MHNTYTTHSEEETKAIGKTITETLNGGDIVTLVGDLGAGKTTFTKGLAEGLGITDTITSPTFTLMNVYKLPQAKNNIHTLVHIDTYRLEDEEELKDIGVEDYLGEPNTLVLIEWPEKLQTLLKDKNILTITLEHQKDNERKIQIQ
ncbi:MAG: tRNA (adenosine(37)-N6)-threonylcarbamoyltransferase complex ATPase subunit type 1 TsaE [Candidatus Magasanikbacteria bacterium]